MVAPPSFGDAKKLEQRAEEIVDAYLTAGLERGEWRALDALVDRVYGKAQQTIVTEPEENKLEQVFNEMSIEEIKAYIRANSEPKYFEPHPDPRPSPTGTPEDYAWKARNKAHPEPKSGQDTPEYRAWRDRRILARLEDEAKLIARLRVVDGGAAAGG